jgi:predicted metal-dependent phosphoesterase TrpH
MEQSLNRERFFTDDRRKFISGLMVTFYERDYQLNLIRVEFHCHTIYSKDSLTPPERLVKACRRKGIDRVVVTDHNTIAGARVAHALAPELVIVGEEIMTTHGEILAAYITEEIPAGLSPQETIRRLKEQGAFISVSHPFDVYRSGHWDKQDLLDILPYVDAIETFNSRCWSPEFNHQAQRFAEEHNIPGTVGSDAHAPLEVGRAVLLLVQFQGPDELRAVIRRGIPKVRWSSPWVHLLSRYAVIRKGGKVGLDMKIQP